MLKFQVFFPHLEVKEKFDNRKFVGVCSILEKSGKKEEEKKKNTEKNMKKHEDWECKRRKLCNNNMNWCHSSARFDAKGHVTYTQPEPHAHLNAYPFLIIN